MFERKIPQPQSKSSPPIAQSYFVGSEEDLEKKEKNKKTMAILFKEVEQQEVNAASEKDVVQPEVQAEVQSRKRTDSYGATQMMFKSGLTPVSEFFEMDMDMEERSDPSSSLSFSMGT
jgi:hypothetical protein